MASNSEWKEDNQLENDLRKYVSQNFKRSEILDFVQRDFAEYTWSTATLGGRRGGLMVSALDLGASGPGSSPGRGHCVVFLGKTLYSHGASLHPGV